MFALWVTKEVVRLQFCGSEHASATRRVTSLAAGKKDTKATEEQEEPRSVAACKAVSLATSLDVLSPSR
jgi:hypothetical protein